MTEKINEILLVVHPGHHIISFFWERIAVFANKNYRKGRQIVIDERVLKEERAFLKKQFLEYGKFLLDSKKANRAVIIVNTTELIDSVSRYEPHFAEKTKKEFNFLKTQLKRFNKFAQDTLGKNFIQVSKDVVFLNNSKKFFELKERLAKKLTIFPVGEYEFGCVQWNANRLNELLSEFGCNANIAKPIHTIEYNQVVEKAWQRREKQKTKKRIKRKKPIKRKMSAGIRKL